VQAACVAGIGVVALKVEGRLAGWWILALVTAFSLARGFCSVASKDVLGKTVPKKIRGQLTDWSASAAGLVTIGVGIVLMSPALKASSATLIGTLLALAGLLWVLAALVYGFVNEYAGETGGGRSVLQALAKLELLASDKPFRRFVITRSLLMCSALSAPFYIALAQQDRELSPALLGAFVAAGGLASLLSAPFWGRFADASSRKVMVAAAMLTSTLGLMTFGVDQLYAGLIRSDWFLPLAYFTLSVAHSGVRVGRKTYVIDLATGNQRTDYVAISNTVIGVLLLVVGSVGALAPVIGNTGVIALLAVMGLCGAFLGFTLPETSDAGN
jgi:hypothetical protein